MNHNGNWTTSVSELLGLLRQALVALVPVAEKAKMHWEDGQSYDDWEDIASALYQSIVVKSLECSEAATTEIELPRYDIEYPSYRDLDLIVVEAEGSPAGTFPIFLRFAGLSPSFDTVACVDVTVQDGIPIAPLRYVSSDQARFYFVPRGNRNLRVDTLTVIL